MYRDKSTGTDITKADRNIKLKSISVKSLLGLLNIDCYKTEITVNNRKNSSSATKVPSFSAH